MKLAFTALLPLALLFWRCFYFRKPSRFCFHLCCFVLWLWTIGLMGLLGVEMSLVSIILPQAIIITGLGSSIHVVNEFRALRKRFLQRKIAAIESVSITGMPCFLTALTTGIGFLNGRRGHANENIRLLLWIGRLFLLFLSVTLIPAILSAGEILKSSNG